MTTSGSPVRGPDAGAATVITDRSDYNPGSTAEITASGFLPGECVTVQISHADDVAPEDVTDPEAHLARGFVADASGEVHAEFYVDPGDAVDHLFRVTADAASGHAETTFTDSLTCNPLAATSCTGTGTSLQCGAVTAVSGDYLIAHITSKGSASTLTAPGGWTQLGSTQTNGTSPGMRTAVYYKAWAAAGDAQPSFGVTAGQSMLGVTSWRGCNAPSGFVAANGTTTTAVTVPAGGRAASFFAGYATLGASGANWTDNYTQAATGGIAVGGAQTNAGFTGSTTNAKSSAVFADAVILNPGGVGTGSIGATCTVGADCMSGWCSAGACAACSTAANCDDGNVCTTDACNSGVCSHANNAASCDDGNACTYNDVCAAGACGGTTITCTSTTCQTLTCNGTSSCSVANTAGGTACADDGNVCTTDLCDGSGACAHAAGNAGTTCRASVGGCDQAETCNGSSTTCPADGLNNAACNDSNVCTVDSCNKVTTALPPSVNVDMLQWASSFGSAPTWSCTAAGTTTINSQTGQISGDTCGGTVPNIANCASGGSCAQGVTQTTSGGPSVMVVRLQGLTVSGGHIIKLVGDKPVIFAVAGNVTVDTAGRIDAGAVGTTAGAGGAVFGAAPTWCSGSTGVNGTQAGGSDGSGAGGGGFGTAGGNGGTGDNNNAGGTGGLVSTDTDLMPLRGGCAGGKGGRSPNALTGAGGGAFEISASGTVNVTSTGILSANGGAGQGINDGCCTGDGGDGAGSGGGILVVAPTTPTTAGALRAHGGGGGGGEEGGTSAAGQDGHSADDTAATGGNGQNNGGKGGSGGLTRFGGASAAGLTGVSNTNGLGGGGGGGGGGGRVVVTTSASTPAAYCTNVAGNAGTVCRASAGVCDSAETCTGSSAACPADVVASAGTPCRASAGVCDPAEACDGSSGACPADAKSPNGTVCRAAAGVCDVGEACDGSSNNCPTDNFAPSSAVCRAAVAGGCDVAESCTGSSAACPADVVVPAGTTCRASAGACDVAETCNGSNTCPANGFVSSSTVCRASAGVCDAAENCTGSSAACPADAKVAGGTVCRASAGVCDVGEACDGSSDDCPTDVFAPSSAVCRPAVASGCDVAENCTGSSAPCPADSFAAAGTSCRSAVNECDLAESCTGSSSACPSDTVKPAGTACTDDGNACSTDTCNGTVGSVACTHPAGNAGAVCRAAAGDCDIADTCTGSSTTCPNDVRQPSTYVCRGATGDCDAPEYCRGNSCAVGGCDSADGSCTTDNQPCYCTNDSQCPSGKCVMASGKNDLSCTGCTGSGAADGFQCLLASPGLPASDTSTTSTTYACAKGGCNAAGGSCGTTSGTTCYWDPLESTCRHASLSIL